jgi:hypothetical protein
VPLKTCPECGEQHGPRKKECECGYAFITKGSSASHPLVPEPGGWVLDTYKGLPEIEPPEPLPKGQLDVETVRDTVAYEGLGFCIYSLIPASRIKDRRLRKLWSDARAAMQKVQECIYE